MQMKNMKLKLYYLAFFLAGLALFSCKNAQKLYQQGNYDAAVELAAKKLQKKPGDTKLIAVLQDAYRFAVEDHENSIRNYSAGNDPLRSEHIYREYSQLQSLYESVRRSPSVFDVVQPTDYSSFVSTYKEEAGNARYERGLKLMDQHTRDSYREAYFEFERALALKPGDLPIRQKMDESYASAVTNVVVMPLTRVGYQFGSHNFDYHQFNYNLLRYLNNNNRSQFVRFFPESDPASRNARVDNFLEMRFSDVNIGRYRDSRETREVSKQVVAKEIVHKKDSVVKEYITVKAKITITTRVIQANALLQAIVRDHDNRRLWSDTYRGDYGWSYSFATYTGDERALSDEDKRLVNQREEFPPSNDEIIRIIMADIQRQTECGVSEYFNRVH